VTVRFVDPSTLRPKEGHQMDIREFGATGGSNDATTIQKALDAAKAAGGGTVWVPPGTYDITATLKVASGVTFYGTGPSSVIENVANANDLIRNDDQSGGNTQVVIRDLRLQGGFTGTPNFQKGVYLKKCTGALVERLWVSNTYLQGIQSDLGSRVRIVNNDVTSISHGNGISIDDHSTNSVIAGNTIASVYDSGIGVHNGSARNVITGNTIDTTTVGYGVDVFGAPETIVSNNAIKSSANIGIFLHTVDGNADIPSRCVVTGNTIYTAGQDGIQVLALADDQIHEMVISDNVIYDPAGAGVYLGNGVQRGTVIRGNSIYSAGSGASGNDHGIMLVHSTAGTPYRVLINGNYVRGSAGYGIYASANVADCLITDNHVGGNTGGTISVPGGNTTADNFLT
jgi:polygalacturonase